MKLLDRIENALENLMEGFFRRNSNGHIQPFEIGKSLIRVMESQKRVSISKTYVPNCYEIYLHPDQAQQFKSMHNTLAQELKEVLQARASKEQLSFIGQLQFKFLEDSQLASSAVQIKAYYVEDQDLDHQADLQTTTNPNSEGVFHTQVFTMVDQMVRQPFILYRNSDGEKMINLVETPFSLGRSKECDFVINDTNVSRTHAILVLEEDGWKIKDNNSTNGTYVNEVRVTETKLKHNDLIRVGNTELIYKEYE